MLFGVKIGVRGKVLYSLKSYTAMRHDESAKRRNMAVAVTVLPHLFPCRRAFQNKAELSYILLQVAEYHK